MKPSAIRYVTLSRLSALAVALTGVSVLSSVAADFQGATAVLQKVEDLKRKVASTPATRRPSELLREQLQQFSTNWNSMSVTAAASGWLALADQQANLTKPESRMKDQGVPAVTPLELVTALPGPSTWAELSKAIRARPSVSGPEELPEIGLRLLAAALTGDSEARQRELAALHAKASKADPTSQYAYRMLFQQVGEAILGVTDDPDAVLKSLEYRLASASEDHGLGLSIPNLVSIVGSAKAETFLRQAIEKGTATLEFEQETETSRLARKLGLELINQMKKPQWGLVNSLEGVEIYEAMNTRFSKTNAPEPVVPIPGVPGLLDTSVLPRPDRDYQKAQAQTYYLLGLIARERSTEAVVVARSLAGDGNVYLPQAGIKAMERAGFARALDQFFFTLLTQDPTLPFWDEYVPLAAKVGQTERMLILARSTAERKDLSAAKKAEIQQTRLRALLAADQIDAGVDELRRLLQGAVPTPRSFTRESPGQLALTLARIGLLMNRPEWIEEGLRAGRKSMEASVEPQASWGADLSIASGFAGILSELGRGPEIEGLVVDALGRVKQATRGEQEGYAYAERAAGSGRLLVLLSTAYREAGRPSDVLTLLTQSPDWGVRDLKDIGKSDGRYSRWSNGQGGAFHLPEPPPLLLGAWALAEGGRREEAQRAVEVLLNRLPGFDPGYQLLLQLMGEGALVKLDELFRRDRFEERPLIWKAELLRRLQRWEEAEQAARQAITIDPSDGEQGRGDRLRAYAVLADIRQARGDAKEAAFLRGAVGAIRLSEQADRFYAAGLLKRAIAMYEDSLKQFADAYCIQSRLAVQLAELGRHDEAEAHYRRAYELMPDSFGRVESHCFGCERAFEGQRAQGMAEKIFQDLAVKTPEKPQVHYLLGYLRLEQERYAEAQQHFQTAVRLDPDYLSAWQKLQSSTEQVRLPSRERDQILLNILRLDPLRRHSHGGLEKITDLTALWNAVAAGSAREPVEPADLLILTASQAALEKSEKARRDRGERVDVFQRAYRGPLDEAERWTPAIAVSQTPFVRAAIEILSLTSMLE